MERVIERGDGWVIVKRYLHGKDDELSDLWEPEAEQQETYHYALYEVAVDLKVDLSTGESKIVAVDGVRLEGEG